MLEAVAYESQLGDVNFDGSLDVIDIIMIVNIILDTIDYTDAQLSASDINGDGGTDVTDIINLVTIILNN